MKVKFNNSTLIFNTKEREVIVDLDVVITPHLNDYFPAKSTGEQVNSGAYRGYYADLTGLYQQGYRKVKFKANQKSSASGVYVMGIVCTSPIPTDIETKDVVESAIDASVKSLNIGWYELPITANSKCLHATYGFSSQYVSGLELWTPVNGDAKASTYEVEA